MGLMALVLLLAGGVWIFRRSITISLLERVNETIPGTIIIGDGELSWRRFFTRLSLRLDEVVLIDEKGVEVIRAGEIGAEVNPLALIRHRIEVQSLVLSDVKVELRMDDSGGINLLDALGLESTGGLPDPEQREETDNSEGRWRHWSADVKGVRFENCRAGVYQNGASVSILLEYLDMDIVRVGANGNIALASAFSDIQSDSLGPGYFKGKRYQLDLDIDMKEGVAVVKTGILDVQGARIKFGGQAALFHPYEADLLLEARGTDTDLLLTFLPPGVELGDVVPEGNGEIVIDAYLDGPLSGRPRMRLDVVCDDFGLRHVPTGMVMGDIGFELIARIGEGEISLDLKDLNARLPDGDIHANFTLMNPKAPRVMLDLDARLNLFSLASFFNFPGSESLAGEIEVDVDVAGRFDDTGRLREREREGGIIHLSDFRYILPASGSGIQNLDLLFTLEDGFMEIHNLEAVTDIGEISLNGFFGDVWPLLLGGEGPLRFGLDITSPLINPSALFEDPVVAASWDRDLEDVSLGLVFDTTAEALRSAAPLPKGAYRIIELKARVPKTGKVLSDFSGGIEISDGLTADLRGRLQGSDVSLEIGLDGYEYLLRGNEAGTVTSHLVLKSSRLTVADFLPTSVVDDDSWLNRSLNDVLVDLELSFENSDWFESLGSWPEGRWTLHEFSGRSMLRQLPYLLTFDLLSRDNRADLSVLTGRLGQSVFTAHGYLNDLEALQTLDMGRITGNLVLDSDYLDMSDFIKKREEPEPGGSEPGGQWELGRGTYPNVSLDLHVSEFLMTPIHWRDIGGTMGLSSDGIVRLEDISFSGEKEGRAGVDGTIDLSRTDSIFLKADVTLDEIRLEDSMIPINNGKETVNLGKMVKGVLDGRVGLDAVVNPDLSIDLSRSVMDVKVVLAGGRLVEFPPFVAIADRFRNRNMRDVRLDTLRIRAELADGRLDIPRTAVGSTLGYLELEGYSTVDSFMSYSVTVPNSVIDDVVTGMIFGGGDDGVEDEIINAENSGRSRTTINVVGTPEDIIIGIGKRGRERLEDRWNRRNDRRIRREN